jgi:hypothetical protein
MPRRHAPQPRFFHDRVSQTCNRVPETFVRVFQSETHRDGTVNFVRLREDTAVGTKRGPAVTSGGTEHSPRVGRTSRKLWQLSLKTSTGG